jgi:predicted dinucleotide-binding enzyme
MMETGEIRQEITAVHDVLNLFRDKIVHDVMNPDKYHLLQRYLPRIKETDTELVVVTGEPSDTLSAFLQSTQPALEYTVVADPKHSASHAIQAGDDTIAIIVDNQRVVRWFERWPGHQDEPGYGIILQALRDVRDAEGRNDG